MSLMSARRSAVALTATAPLLLGGVATPAAAAPPDMSSSRTTTVQADAQWVEQDPEDLLGLPGNTHVGSLFVYSTSEFTDVFGFIQDYQCDEGEVPGGGGHGEVPGPVPAEPGEPGEGLCDPAGTRFLAGQDRTGPTATISVDTSAGTATLSGSLLVHGGHGEDGEPEVIARPPVAMTWVAVGGVEQFRDTRTSTDGTYRLRRTGIRFFGTLTGRIGPMGFADDADDESFGSVEAYRETSRYRAR